MKINIKKLPDSPGVYQFFNQNNKLIYVGKSISIKKRVSSYFTTKNLLPKTKSMVDQIRSIKYIKVFSEFEALLLESEVIRINQPFFNVIAKDDKSPLYIKITNDYVPLITTTRKLQIKKGIFLKGPFPSALTTKEILRMVRKIFPYCHHKNPKKPCLYVHLGLCPYPNQSKIAQAAYQNSISKIKKLLNGKSLTLSRQLEREMKYYSKTEQYEKAQAIKNQIEKLEYITSTYRSPKQFLERPTLVDEITSSRLQILAKELYLKKIPNRIECYDISNLSGLEATGSMVVFLNGQAAKDQYRKFKIRFTSKPNDYQMLKEVLDRRFKNKWSKPDLIIVDGGIGQLNVIIKVVKQLKLQIKVIAIAKKFEKIYTSDPKTTISLPNDNPAKLLAQAIRDEAHRFAITYHRLLRSKNFLTN